MSIVFRNYENFEDYSALMELVPRQENLLDQIGLFEKDYHQGTLIELERISDKIDQMYAVPRDADRQFTGRGESRLEPFKIPFFTLDGTLRPNELQDLREWSTPDAPATVQRSVDKIISRIQKGHFELHTKIMYHVLTTGTAYAKGKDGADMPEYAADFAARWGVTRKTATLDLTNATQDPSVFVEKEVRKHIYDNMGDNSTSVNLVAIVGSGFFNAFTKHPLVKEAYLNRDGDSAFLTDRISGNIQRRSWDFDGVTYIEEPNSALVARNKAFFFPMGVEGLFRLDYAPANTLEHANTIAEEAYLFVEEQRRKIVVESEVSVLGSTTRPELIVEITGTLPAWT